MDFWLTWIDESIEQTIEVARLAEAAGFRGLALADHVAVPVDFSSLHPAGAPAPFDHRSDFPDPLITAATVLAATTTLEVMSYVYVLPMREPFSVASQVASLAALSAGRFRFGVGAGWLTEEIEMLGYASRGRGRRMDEMLQILGRFWREDSVEFHGEFFDFQAAGINPKPPEPVSVWVGGKSPAALARAARHQGWLGMNYALPEVYALLEALERAREAAGSRDPFETFVIPEAEPSRDLYQDLAARGVTSTVGAAWGYADRSFGALEAKRDAIARFADAFIVT